MENEVKIVIVGSISDFARVDNVYSSLKRESGKLFSKWSMEINLQYSESEIKEG